MTLCVATRTDGKPCAGSVIEGSTYCKYHAPLLGRHEWDPAGLVLTEAAVVAAFCRSLEAGGWVVQTEVDHVDILATREGVTLIAEAKGMTAAKGLDVDTLYGQLLRRMSDLGPTTRYAVVVPEALRTFAERVSASVRQHLNIEVVSVSENSDVRW
jgi:hypothetical protein